MKNKKNLILSVFICFMAIILVSCTAASKNEIMMQIDNGNYQQALEDMNNLNSFEREEVQNKALAKVTSIVNGVKNGSISYSDAVDQLDFIKKIVPKMYENKVTKAINEVKLEEQNKM